MKKISKKNRIIDGASVLSWTVDDIIKMFQQNKKTKQLTGKEIVEVYPKINDYGKLHWHIEVYKYETEK